MKYFWIFLISICIAGRADAGEVYSISKNEFTNRYNNETLKNLPHNGYYTNGIVDAEKNIWVAGSNRLLKLNSDYTVLIFPVVKKN